MLTRALRQPASQQFLALAGKRVGEHRQLDDAVRSEMAIVAAQLAPGGD
jgi:hypothetical protein